jgi:hypothetical protein
MENKIVYFEDMRAENTETSFKPDQDKTHY